MLDEGVCATVSEIGDAENISKSYVSRILRLALLGARHRRGDPRGKDGSERDAGAAGAGAAGELGGAANLTGRACIEVDVATDGCFSTSCNIAVISLDTNP
jgi:hypothetical protein